jgi:hypothetical protein
MIGSKLSSMEGLKSMYCAKGAFSLMSKPASNDLSDRVRRALPSAISGLPWNVRTVEEFHEAGADLYAGVVRVHETWLESIYEAGLFHVTKHYPLAVGPFEEADPQLLRATDGYKVGAGRR